MSDFWTRRRARVQSEAQQAEAEYQALEAARTDAALTQEQAALTEPELLESLGLPNPDSLKAGDDFTAFLRREVPEVLRRRALRRLWASKPVLANLDGLVDHGDDFTDAATVKTGMQTVYKVGQGMFERLKDSLNAVIAEAEDQPAQAPEASSVRRPAPVRAAALPVAEALGSAEPALFDEPPAGPQHMQFHFTEVPA